jgi:hypothetical protein
MTYKKVPLIFMLFVLMSSLAAQEKDSNYDITPHAIWYPHAYTPYHVQTALGFSMVKPPMVWVYTSLTAPLINFHMTFGLPKNFAIVADVSTIVVSNQVTLGPNWNYRHDNFSFNLGYNVGFLFCQMKVKEFDNRGTAVILYPNISVGYKLKKIAFTLRGELSNLAYTHMTAGDAEINHNKRFFNGGSCALYVEQRLWKDHVMVFGLKDNINKLYWPVWMLFNTYNRFYQIPELYFSFVL